MEILETNGITDGFSCCDEDLPGDSHQLHIVDEEGEDDEDFDEGDEDADDSENYEASGDYEDISRMGLIKNM